MTVKFATIIAGPHLLFTGANGVKTYGITVRSDIDEKKAGGYKQEWSINDHSIANAPPGAGANFGLSNDAWIKLQAEVAAMVAAQT